MSLPDELPDRTLLQMLQCPACEGRLDARPCELQCTNCHRVFRVVEGIPVFADDRDEHAADLEINKTKWRDYWRNFEWEAEEAKYSTRNTPYIVRRLGELRPGTNFLEIGGGASLLSFGLAATGVNVFSVDLDLDVLLTARRNFSKHNRSGHFVQGDINRLPFKAGSFSASAGIGVLEHSRHFARPIRELHRVTCDHGFTFQTVPYLSLLTLLGNSMRFGTAPNVAGLRQLVEFVHIKLLRMRYMKYGYEQSFTYRHLRKIFAEAGFRSVETGFYDYDQTLFRQNAVLGKILRRLITLRVMGATPFADVAYVTAVR